MAKPKVVSSDIYKYVAQQSSLSVAQVKECFSTYYDIVMALVTSDNRPNDLRIALPKIGLIDIVEVKGVPKGYTYTLHGQTNTVNEDRLDYERLKITVNDTTQLRVRASAENKSLRKQSINLDFLKECNNHE